MENKKNASFGVSVLLFLLLHLFEYAIEHAIYLLTDASLSGALRIDTSTLNAMLVIAEYAVGAIEIFSIGITALVLIINLSNSGIKSTVFLGISLILTRLVYIFPHYYMSFISYGYDTSETILFIIPLALFILLVTLAVVAATVALALIPAMREARRTGAATREVIGAALASPSLIDLDNKATAAMLISSAVPVGIHTAIAVYDTATLFAKYGVSLPPLTVLSVVLRFTLLVAALVLLHLSLSFIRNMLVRSARAQDDREGSESGAEATEECQNADTGAVDTTTDEEHQSPDTGDGEECQCPARGADIATVTNRE